MILRIEEISEKKQGKENKSSYACDWLATGYSEDQKTFKPISPFIPIFSLQQILPIIVK